MGIVKLEKLTCSLKEFSSYIHRFKNILKKFKASTRRGMINTELIISFKNEMRYGCILVRKECKDKVKS